MHATGARVTMKLFFEVRFKEKHICRLHGVAADVCENVCSMSYDLKKCNLFGCIAKLCNSFYDWSLGVV